SARFPAARPVPTQRCVAWLASTPQASPVLVKPRQSDRDGDWSFLRTGPADPQPRNRAAGWTRPQRHVSVPGTRQLARDRQTEPVPRRAAAPRRTAMESVEDELELVLGDPGPVVDHIDRAT